MYYYLYIFINMFNHLSGCCYNVEGCVSPEIFRGATEVVKTILRRLIFHNQTKLPKNTRFHNVVSRLPNRLFQTHTYFILRFHYLNLARGKSTVVIR